MSKSIHPFLTLPGLADASKPLLQTLLAERPMPLTALEGIVSGYTRVIEDVAKKNRRVNAELGRAIAGALASVLARVDDRTGDQDYGVIQSAVRYFVVQNDGGGDDFDSLDGFVDDARVVNLMLRWLGRDDLNIVIPERVARPPSRVFGGAATTARR